MLDIWQEIYGTIKRNKLRTFLTGFAVAWGIFMLIVLLGAGNGLIHAFEKNSSERALNSMRIGAGWTAKSYDGLKEGRRIILENKDLLSTSSFFVYTLVLNCISPSSSKDVQLLPIDVKCTASPLC